VTGPLVLKLGGELLDAPSDRARLASAVAAMAAARPLVIVHGGGKAVDAAMARQGLAPKKVDGLRVTDDATLGVVISVLGGLTNTELVASLVGHGVPAVGLSGVDAGFGVARRASAHRTASSTVVDLGFVGDPMEPDTSLVSLLLAHGYVPVVASLGIDLADADPQVLNVNADVMACRLAAALDSAALVIAGTTAGVFDGEGRTIAELDVDGLDAIVRDGTASAGMIAKLLSCRTAIAEGVTSVRIIDGRALDASGRLDSAPGTTLVDAAPAARPGPARVATATQDGHP